jgi:hypothetical protein
MGLSWGSLYQNFVTQHKKKINGKSGGKKQISGPSSSEGIHDKRTLKFQEMLHF